MDTKSKRCNSNDGRIRKQTEGCQEEHVWKGWTRIDEEQTGVRKCPLQEETFVLSARSNKEIPFYFEESPTILRLEVRNRSAIDTDTLIKNKEPYNLYLVTND